MITALELRHYGHGELPEIRQTLIDVHAEIHAAEREDRQWWREHLTTAPERAATFHFSELMVRERWRKTGTAERLHRALMDARDEDLAALLVDVTHPKVQALYESWGYRKVGERQPFPHSPVFAVMLVDLPLY
ncbi:hypothetical protein SLNWT_6957 [Streptomyces albus]|uniref:N-acetyltransferase domain-containing protein n=1 Tax=Streptomyces albus (strain ATCC 21838 / DSM 41398 / FERM P-419 / JCM 4703 / NBRC 107858) TaxID=1081613 RepID=A0A0B5EX15_STRA4|nr:hypothetical protein SLNWT_6957 [Streptomyces albus]AOU81636.1 hypothetical protein SLNHY_6945 [Streptomyces albus]AYN37327.1 GNAT family N-acetyltransferase [Streptomyces albus]